MHTSHNHWCVFTADVLPWEKSAFQPILNWLAKRIDIGTLGADEAKRPKAAKTVWIVTHDWRTAAKRAARFGSKTQVYISVLGLNPRSTPLPALPFEGLLPKLSKNTILIAHSPLNHRFLLEMDQIPKEKVLALPLAVPELATNAVHTTANRLTTVATFAPFSVEGNHNFFLTLAHYVMNRRSDVRFTVLGSGKLFQHVSRITEGLALHPRANVLETFDAKEIGHADVFVYAPLRNDHFVPLQIAASHSKPVVCSDVPGVTDLVQDGHSGFIVSGADVKAMGELILRYADDERLRKSMGAQLNRRLNERFSADQIGKLYEKLLTGQMAAISETAAA